MSTTYCKGECGNHTHGESDITEYVPVVGSGEYVCEMSGCDVVQNDESTDHVLFYRNGTENIYCMAHV